MDPNDPGVQLLNEIITTFYADKIHTEALELADRLLGDAYPDRDDALRLAYLVLELEGCIAQDMPPTKWRKAVKP